MQSHRIIIIYEGGIVKGFQRKGSERGEGPGVELGWGYSIICFKIIIIIKVVIIINMYVYVIIEQRFRMVGVGL
jgi:hypothetical protein